MTDKPTTLPEARKAGLEALIEGLVRLEPFVFFSNTIRATAIIPKIGIAGWEKSRLTRLWITSRVADPGKTLL